MNVHDSELLCYELVVASHHNPFLAVHVLLLLGLNYVALLQALEGEGGALLRAGQLAVRHRDQFNATETAHTERRKHLQVVEPET